jgi:hypothetical protein
VSQGSDGDIRLETHVWHAKRFAMEHLWGHVLASGLPGRGRGSRSILRGAHTAALVHDSTYLQAVQLEGPRSVIVQILESVSSYKGSALRNGSGKGERRATEESGAVACEVMLHREGEYPLGAIAPATLMWRPERAPSQGASVGKQGVEVDTGVGEGLALDDVSMRNAFGGSDDGGLGDYIPLEGASHPEGALTANAAQAAPIRTTGFRPDGRTIRPEAGGAMRDQPGKGQSSDWTEEDGRGGLLGPDLVAQEGEGAAQVLLWIHAAAFEEALGVLQGACARQVRFPWPSWELLTGGDCGHCPVSADGFFLTPRQKGDPRSQLVTGMLGR